MIARTSPRQFGTLPACAAILVLSGTVAFAADTATPPPKSAAPDITHLVQSWQKADADAGWHVSALPQAGLKHSAITLMPEGLPDDVGLFAPLRPAWAVWGEDPIGSMRVKDDGTLTCHPDFKGLVLRYAAIGVTQTAVNVWMLTATERFMHGHPAYADAVCLDIEGARIVPPWVADADYEGTKTWWGCTNHPLFRDLVRARMRAGVTQGASLVHLDDHAGTYACTVSQGGCFCPWCMTGFRAWLQTRATDAQRTEAAKLGSLASFDYGAILRARGFTSAPALLQASWKGEVPLWNLFREFQRETAVAFVLELRSEAERVAGRPIPLGVNAYNLLPHQLLDARVVDYFANEIEHVGKEADVAPFAYRLAEALGRPAFATGCGEDWIVFNRTHCVTRVRSWFAQAYAFGQFFMYSWNKWGFSKETGTVWTKVDPAVFQPMTDFVAANAGVFDDHENVAAVGVLYDNDVADRESWGVREVVQELLAKGVPFRVVPVGEGFLKRAVDPYDVALLEVLIVPPDVKPSAATEDTLAEWTRAGGRVLTWPEARSRLSRLPGRIEVRGKSGGAIWALPRAANGRSLVVHLLNRDYDEAADAMRRPGTFEVVIPRTPLTFPFLEAVRAVRYHRPGEEAREVAYTWKGDRLVITVPDLEIWGVLEIDSAPAGDA